MKRILILLITIVSLNTLGQNRLTFSFEYPLQYELAYTHLFNEMHGPSLGIGLLTKPFDDWIINDLESNGTDEEIVRLLRESKRRGVILNLGYRFEYEKFFIEPRYQIAWINAKNSTFNVLLEFYELEELTELLELLGFGGILNSPVTMKSQLQQFALRFGYSIPLDEHWGIVMSAGGSVYLNSKAELESRLSRIDAVQEFKNQLENDLNNAHKTGACFYTLSLSISYSW